MKLQWHLNAPVLYLWSFKVLGSKMAAKSLNVYAVMTITFDHTIGVQLMSCSMQLAAECLQVPWWDVRDANSVPLLPWANEANLQENLSQFASLMSEQNGSPGGNTQRFTCLFISVFLPPSNLLFPN